MLEHQRLSKDCPFAKQLLCSCQLDVPPPSKDMRMFPNRLESFRKWPTVYPVFPNDLAKAGFYYMGPADRVGCFFCSKKLKHWAKGDVPAQEHRRISPQCSFARNCTGTAPEPQATLPNMNDFHNRKQSFDSAKWLNIRCLDTLAQSGFYYFGKYWYGGCSI